MPPVPRCFGNSDKIASVQRKSERHPRRIFERAIGTAFDEILNFAPWTNLTQECPPKKNVYTWIATSAIPWQGNLFFFGRMKTWIPQHTGMKQRIVAVILLHGILNPIAAHRSPLLPALDWNIRYSFESPVLANPLLGYLQWPVGSAFWLETQQLLACSTISAMNVYWE